MAATFYLPTRLTITHDSSAELLAELKDAHPTGVFVLTDQGIRAAGIADHLLRALDDAGHSYTLFDDIPGNPNVPDVARALAAVAGKAITHVVAIGGGSVIDTAKAVGLLLADPELDYEAVQWKRQTIRRGSLPVIGLPTTAGTGSEATRVAVIGDSRGFKMGVVHPALFLKTAILDGTLMRTLPPTLTAATGMDALVHGIEAFLSRRANPLADVFALQAVQSVVRWLPTAYRDGADLDARDAMSLAATWAGIAFDQSSLGLVHALAGPLCGAFHLHHGLGVAALLPAVLEYNAPAIPADRLERLLQALGLPPGAQAAELGPWARRLLTSFAIPVHLAALGLTAERIPELAEGATRMAMIGFNIRPADAADCRRVLEAGL